MHKLLLVSLLLGLLSACNFKEGLKEVGDGFSRAHKTR